MNEHYTGWLQRASDAYASGFETSEELTVYQNGRALALAFNKHVAAITSNEDYAKDYAIPFLAAIEVFSIPAFRDDLVREIEELKDIPHNAHEFSTVFMKNLFVDHKDQERLQLAYFLGVHNGVTNREDEPSRDNLEDIDYTDADGVAIEANIHTHLRQVTDNFLGLLDQAVDTTDVPVWKERFGKFQTIASGLLLKDHSLLKVFYDYCKAVRNHGADCALTTYGEKARTALLNVSPKHVHFIDALFGSKKNTNHSIVVSWKAASSRTTFFYDLLSYVGLALSSRKHIEKLVLNVDTNTDANFSWWFQIVVNVVAVLPRLKKIAFVKTKKERSSFFHNHSFSLYLNYLGVYTRINPNIRALSINKNVVVDSSSIFEEFMERVFSRIPGEPTIKTLKFPAQLGDERTSRLFASIFGHADIDLSSIVTLKFGQRPHHEESVYLPVLRKISSNTLKSLQLAFVQGEAFNELLTVLSGLKLERLRITLNSTAFVNSLSSIVASFNDSMSEFSVDILIDEDTDENAITQVIEDFRSQTYNFLWSIATPTQHYVNNDEIDLNQQTEAPVEETPIEVVTTPSQPLHPLPSSSSSSSMSTAASSSSPYVDERDDIAAKLRQTRRRPK